MRAVYGASVGREVRIVILPLRALAAKYSLPPMTRVLHIGGHYGEECDEYFREGAASAVFFEPSTSSFQEMARRIGERPGVCLVHAALGNYNGTGVLLVETANAGQSSSLLKAKVHATQYPQITFDSTESITVIRLDNWQGLSHFGPWDLLAIDVQGYELEVFKGAEETLKSVQAISAEINREELYEGCALVGEVDAWLAARGFDRVETEWCGGGWGEAIFVRRRPAP
jgi:FkbM family methyltransferase